MPLKIAIDGPAGAGKSSLARILADRLSLVYLDTGAMYRTLGLKVLSTGGDYTNKKDVLRALANSTIDVRLTASKEQRFYLDGADVTGDIRTRECSMAASSVSAFQEVREELVAMQRAIAEGKDVVMDGRDIGTVVLADADFKFYVTATARARAQRRLAELLEKGQLGVTLGELEAEIEKRDYDDSHREHSPLVPAKDALIVDTTDMTLDEAADYLCGIVGMKHGGNA